MRPYQEFEDEIRRRQALALSGAARRRLLRSGAPTGPARPGLARVAVAGALRQLAGWIDGSGGAAASVTLRPS